MTSRTALIVRGGWDGHQPVQATEVFIPFLEDNGSSCNPSRCRKPPKSR